MSLLPAAYLCIAALLGVYGLHRVALLMRFRWSAPPRRDADPRRVWPRVTVQLPIYNERTVVERLLRAIGELDYPRDALEIQVLDDSTDDTAALVDREVGRLRSSGIDAKVVRRADRAGYKAGALEHALPAARGELIAVFDADFAPGCEFLRRLVPVFDDAGVGMAQARWGHDNRGDGPLTRAQATLLDGHFVIEHKVRFDSRLYFNFNGTAGVWRRRAIDEAGGWQHDTLTEDLDLSYRAQLAGWRFVYAHDVVAVAELPADIAAFKSQQRRWARGSVQVTRKLSRRIATSKVPWRVKLEAFAHLSANMGYPLVLLLALLMPAIAQAPRALPPAVHVALFIACTLSVFWFYERSQRAVGRPLGARLADMLLAVLLGIGMSLSQTLAVIAGLAREPGEFERTPKIGTAPRARRYRAVTHGVSGMELIPAAWLAWGVVEAARAHLWSAVPFLALFCGGFTWVGALSVAHAWSARRTGHETEEACRESSIRTPSTL